MMRMRRQTGAGGRGYRVDLPAPSDVSAELMRKIIPKATKLVKDRALKEVPIGPTGNLKKGIQDRVENHGLQGVVASTAPHTFIIHEGSKRHRIVPVKKRALKLPGGYIRAAAEHPGTKGQPYLTKALAESGPEVERMFRQEGEGFLKKVLG